MAATAPVLSPGLRILDTSGNPISGAKLKFYNTGTTTPRTVYSDAALSVSLGTTVTCDGGGYASDGGGVKVMIYAAPTPALKLIITDSADAILATHDALPSGIDLNTLALTVEYAKSIEPTVSVSSATTLGTSHYGKLIQANASGGSFSLQLPAAATATNGYKFRIRNAGTSGTVSIVASGTEQIEGPSSTGSGYQLVDPRSEVTIVSTGSGWVATALVIGNGTITTAMLSSSISGSFKQVGDVYMVMSETVPAGCLHLNGTAANRTAYAELFALWGTNYGVGDGSTTFGIPDMRGLVPRGWANGSANDPDRASRTTRGDGTTGDHVGTGQADVFKTHLHAAGTLGGSTSGGTHEHNYSKGSFVGGSTFSGSSYLFSYTTTATTGGGAHSHTLNLTGSTANTGATNETRMKNLAVMFVVFADPAAATGASSPLHTILNGGGAPSDGIGSADDFYIDTDAWTIYGPKGSTSWDTPGTILAINPRGPWVTSTAYKIRDLVSNGGSAYLALTAHTSAAGTQPGVGASWQTAWMLFSATGTGDVTGPASATTDGVALFNGTTGKLLKNSSATLSGSAFNILTGVGYSINGVTLLSETGVTLQSGSVVSINGVTMLAGQQTGWGTPTGTLTRTTYVTSTVTLPQLAERVAALITDLKAGNMPKT